MICAFLEEIEKDTCMSRGIWNKGVTWDWASSDQSMPQGHSDPREVCCIIWKHQL